VTAARETTTIRAGDPVVTLINVFAVAPERQQQLVDLLNQATIAVMRQLPGFVSANIHRSLDGTKVANYAQWASQEAFEAMLRNPAAREHLDAATRLAAAAPTLYEVVAVHTKG
jgi:quinol monooxygenase YgiN